jgi:hypothetical protein
VIKLKKIKEHPYILLTGLIFIALGLFLIFVDSSFILMFIHTSMAFMLILLGISKFMLAKRSKLDTYSGIVNIAVGTLFLFFYNFIIDIILGSILVIFPIVRIVLSDNKKLTFKQELPLFLMGIFIIFSGDLFVNIFFKIIGGLLILLGIYQFISIFFERIQILQVNYGNNSNEPTKRRNVVDVSYEEVSRNEEK